MKQERLSLSPFIILGYCIVFFLSSAWLQAAGTTIIMHGWHVSSSTEEPAWTAAMQQAIDDQWLDSEGRLGVITVTGTTGNLVVSCDPWDLDLSNSTHGEIVIRVDWHQVADHLTSGVSAQEVAAAIAPRLYQPQGDTPALVELPMHLIGHSRGGGMICEIARLLGEQGIEVDQLSPLDPHPLTSSDPQPAQPLPPVIDTPVAIYENVLFVDNYWQNISYPEGEYVPGAFNRLWTSLPGGYHNSSIPAYQSIADHLNIPLLYHGTIDLNTPVNNGEATMDTTERDAWYNDFETDLIRGDHCGFYYTGIAGTANLLSSDTPVAGGDAIRDGYHNDPLLGGNGARSSLSWGTAATWPNLVVLEILRDGNPLGPGSTTIEVGDDLTIHWVGRDADSDDTITLFLDADRNPYNGNMMTTIATMTQPGSGSALFQNSLSWDISGIPPGTRGYLLAQISDGTHTRYRDAGPFLVFSSAVFADGFENASTSEWDATTP